MDVQPVKPDDAAQQSRRMLLALQDSLASLTQDKPQHRKGQVLLLRLVRIPFSVAAAVILLPAFAIISLVVRQFKDRAFDNSVRYIACYLINPLIILILSLILLAAGILPWWGVAGLCILYCLPEFLKFGCIGRFRYP